MITDVVLTRVLCQFPESLGQLELGLDLSPELHHPPPALGVLPPDDLYDGGEDRHPHHDVDRHHEHVAGLVPTNEV